MSDFRMRTDKPANKHVHRTHSGGGFQGIDLSTPPPKPDETPVEPPKTHHALAVAQTDEQPAAEPQQVIGPDTIVTDDLTGSEAIVQSDGSNLPKVVSLPPPKRPAKIKKHEPEPVAPPAPVAEPAKQTEILPEAVVSQPSETVTANETEESDNE